VIVNPALIVEKMLWKGLGLKVIEMVHLEGCPE
jgi:hypothetical protein